MRFETKISGIPCLIEINSWTPYIPANTMGHPDNHYPSEGGYGDWEVCDKNGRPAAWLSKKLTSEDRARIDSEASEYMEKMEVEYDH